MPCDFCISYDISSCFPVALHWDSQSWNSGPSHLIAVLAYPILIHQTSPHSCHNHCTFAINVCWKYLDCHWPLFSLGIFSLSSVSLCSAQCRAFASLHWVISFFHLLRTLMTCSNPTGNIAFSSANLMRAVSCKYPDGIGRENTWQPSWFLEIRFSIIFSLITGICHFPRPITTAS